MTREESESIVVTVTCGSCGMKLQAPATGDGGTIKCTRCGAKLRVQLPSGPAPTTPPGSPSPLIPEARPGRPASPVSSVPATPESPLVPEPSPVPQSTPVPELPVRPSSPVAAPEIPPPSQWQLASESAPAETPERLGLVADVKTDVEASSPVMFQALPPSHAPAAGESEELIAWADIRKSSHAAATPVPDPGPAVTEHAVPQRTFTDAAIADEAVSPPGVAARTATAGASRGPEAIEPPKAPAAEKPSSARRTPDPNDASRADAALLLMGVERSKPGVPAVPESQTCATRAMETEAGAAAADQPAPGTRPRFHRDYSAPALPEPIPAMAVLPAQPKAPYLPAATLPSSPRRREAESRAGAAASRSHRSVEDEASSQGESAFAAWFRAIVLTGAVVIVGAIAWAAADRIGGIRNWWVVKFACVAWLIGMGTATAMISSGRMGVGAKLFSIVAASLAIVLGKAAILCLPQVPAVLMNFEDPQRWARAFADLAFIPVDPLFFAMAITGSAVRFILSKRDERTDRA